MWTTDTFLQNLARFSVLKGHGLERVRVCATLMVASQVTSEARGKGG